MNCENCQNLISDLVDGKLDLAQSSALESHLSMCVECAEIREDFAALIGYCDLKRDSLEHEIVPPNSHALWSRINHEIESENQAVRPNPADQPVRKLGFFDRLSQKTWQFSFSQMFSVLVGVALIASLLTIVGIKNFSTQSDSNYSSASVSPSIFDKILSKLGVVETPNEAREKKIREQQSTIDYWNQRVLARKAQWNRKMREAFDRNLQEIDLVVSEYTRTIQENPDDSLSVEMLNSALQEKMELLREFSEL